MYCPETQYQYTITAMTIQQFKADRTHNDHKLQSPRSVTLHIYKTDNTSYTGVVRSAPVKTCKFTTVGMQYQKLTDMQ